MTNNVQALPFPDLGGTWHITYFFGLSIAALIYAFMSRRAWGLPSALLWAYIVINTLFIVEYPRAHFGIFTPYFQTTAAQVFIELFLILYLVTRTLRYILLLTPALAVFSSLCVWFDWRGLMRAPSFNMALAALCLSFVRSPWVIALVVVTALTHHGATALVVIAAQLFALVLKKKIDWKVFTVGSLAIAASSLLFKTQPLLNSTERMAKWMEALSVWAQSWQHMLFGMGPGSYIWYSIMSHPYQTGIFLDLHSEPLQILWELGLVGFVLTMAVCIHAVRKAFRSQSAVPLSGVLGAIALSLTYGSLRYFPTALLTAVIFMTVLVVDDVNV